MEDAQGKTETVKNTKTVYVHLCPKCTRKNANGVCKAKIGMLLRDWAQDKVPKKSCTFE